MTSEKKLRLAKTGAGELPAGVPLDPVSIALVCQSYPPVVGGSEIEAQRVCAALMKRGHKVEVICEGGPPMPDRARWIDPAGIPVRLIGGRLPPKLRGYVYALGVAWTLFAKRAEYDVVYFLMSGLHLATGVPVAHWCGKPVLMKFSGSSLIRRMAFTWLGRLELDFLRRWADRILVLNDGMLEEAAEVNLDTGRISWMPNPVDMDEFRPLPAEEKLRLREELGLPVDAPIVLFVGRLAPEKELSSLIRAFAGVSRERSDALLVFVGDGPSRAELEAQAGPLAPDRIRFAGMAAVGDVVKWLQASDIFTLVSSLEGLPVSLIEAMAVGLPSVVSDIPANVQLIESGKHGLAVPVQDDAAIADSLLLLIEDAALRRRFGDAARASVSSIYSTASVATMYERFFAELLAPGRAARGAA